MSELNNKSNGIDIRKLKEIFDKISDRKMGMLNIQEYFDSFEVIIDDRFDMNEFEELIRGAYECLPNPEDHGAQAPVHPVVGQVNP